MKIVKKVGSFFLVCALILTMAGSGNIQTKKVALAATTKATSVFTIKADSDFKLKLPNSWKGNYVVKKSKKKKQGSYVAFYSKKCYKQTKEGWLFSIIRFKDKSYKELPDYKVVGKWAGFRYVAVYPTDVQCMGVTKAAQRQYMKLNQSSRKVAKSIQRVK